MIGKNNWCTPLRWLTWITLSVILLVSDVFYYINKVETALVGPELFLALAIVHLLLCGWAYRNIIQDQQSRIAMIAGKACVFFCVVMIEFSSHIFGSKSGVGWFIAIFALLAVLAMIKTKKHYIK